jgi:hypothetical protein
MPLQGFDSADGGRYLKSDEVGFQIESSRPAAPKRLFKADPWGGLFRAATTFTEASTGAEKSVGHGGSPKGSRLRLAWSGAPTPKMTSVPEGAVKSDESISGCGLVRDLPIGRQHGTSLQLANELYT